MLIKMFMYKSFTNFVLYSFHCNCVRSNIYLHNKLLPVAILVFFQLKMIWLYLLSNKVLPC